MQRKNIPRLVYAHRLFKSRHHLLFVCVLIGIIAIISCDSQKLPTISTPIETPLLTVEDVQSLITHAVEQAERLNEKVVVAVTDREANVLGVFNMNGTTGNAENPVLGAIAKARTAAYLSSNQHGFSSVTACFITRNHFPPGINNTPGGPLYGVPLSSLGGGDVQPNGGSVLLEQEDGTPGLTGAPGGVPIFKNGLLAGGLGISGGSNTLQLIETYLKSCTGEFFDEIIALGALGKFAVPPEKRGDNIFLDGVRLKFSNINTPDSDFSLSFNDLTGRGMIDSRFPLDAPGTLRGSPTQRFPGEGEVNLGPGFNFMIRGNAFLSEEDVRKSISQAVEQANSTRAAIRRPIGTPARVFVTVVDLNGEILGIWRTPDATLFSYDVSAQKARTVVAFSDPNHQLGQQIRTVLGLDANQPLAVTCRAVGFLAQDFYPPGIDNETLGRAIQAGPLFIPPPTPPEEFQFQSQLGLAPFGNGITIFPGGVPLYKNGQLVGGVGVSGDGVDQDDIISFAGSVGFEPPEEARCDQFFFDGIRLPYVKFPRQPEIDGGN